MKNPFLISENIYLSPLTKDDISVEYISWLNDSEVCKANTHATIPNNHSKTLAYVESVEGSQTEIVFAIRWKENDIHIGNVSLQGINWINRTGEYAVLIGNKKYWNKGVGSESLSLIIQYGLITLNLNRIWSGMFITNKGAMKICEKNEMKKEGVLREAVFKNGKYLDVVIYSILQKDFKKTNQKKD